MASNLDKPTHHSPRSPFKRSATAPPLPAGSSSHSPASSGPHVTTSSKRGPSSPSLNNQGAVPSSPLSSKSGMESHSAISNGNGDGSAVTNEDDAENAPPTQDSIHMMQLALSRLSSQHHLSEYNRMKRLATNPIAGSVSQPMSHSASYPLTARQPAWATGGGAGPAHSPSTNTLPIRSPTGPSQSPGNFVDTYAASGSLFENILPEAGAVAVAGPQLSPPPAPDLHRTYTEEEGHNPRVHWAPRGSVSSVALSTPALSMESIPSSLPVSTGQSSRSNSSRGESQSRRESGSSVPPTPPEGASPQLASTPASNTTSPVNKKTIFDESNDQELSARLLDAMEETVVSPLTTTDASSSITSPPVPGSFVHRPVGSMDSAARLRLIQQQRSQTAKQQSQTQTYTQTQKRQFGNHGQYDRSTAPAATSAVRGTVQPVSPPGLSTAEYQRAGIATAQGSYSNSVSMLGASSSSSSRSSSSLSSGMGVSRGSTSQTSVSASASRTSSLGQNNATRGQAASTVTNTTSSIASSSSSSSSANVRQPTAVTRIGAEVQDASLHAHVNTETGRRNPYYINSYHPDVIGVKTSLTHPMNVSPLIPPELLPLYGQSILRANPVASTASEGGYGENGGENIFPGGISSSPVYQQQQRRARSPLTQISMPDLPPGSNLNNVSSSRPSSPTKSSGSSMMNISRPGTPATGTEGKSFESQSQLHHQHQAKPSVTISSEVDKRPFVVRPSADIHSLTGPNASAALFNLTLPISQHLAMTSANTATGNHSTSSHQDNDSRPVPTKLGNLVLSSCPGKKVRLTDKHLTVLGIPEICRPGGSSVPGSGATTPLIDPRTLPSAAVAMQLSGLNRSPICRDLELDFRRAMSEADIKCVVCCIDDEELRFLGAAWEEYERVARKLGLEIIRLPMAEGFAPPSPDILDGHLSYLITRYTLKGKSVLVHCRGGVGRAGLFACSWMIKLGLLGDIINIHDPTNRTLDGEMNVVEKVITVIRKRRSAKAIETPQQVQFILQYVHWLSSNGRLTTAREVLQEASTWEQNYLQSVIE